MRSISVYVFLGCSQLFLCVDGARKEQAGTIAALHPETSALRRNTKATFTQAHAESMNAGKSKAQMGTSSLIKTSQQQDPSSPVHSVNGMTTTVPGHRPRAFVVASILFLLMMMLFAAIFASIHRKVSDEVAAPLHAQGGLRGFLGHSSFPIPVALDVKTLKAEPPGDLRRVEDEIAELTKDLTPPPSSESPQPLPDSRPESKASAESITHTPKRSTEPKRADLSATPAKVKHDDHLHPALADAPLPTPLPRSPPKNRHKRGKSIDTAATPAPPVVPASDLRNLEDEFAELTLDLAPQMPSSIPQVCQGISAQDFAEVKTLRAVSVGEMRSHDDEFADLIQDLAPSSNRSANGELRSFQDEISELAGDLHTQEPENQV